MDGCSASLHGCEPALRPNLLREFVCLWEIIVDELHLFIRSWDVILDLMVGYAEAFQQEDVLEGIFLFNQNT